MKDVTLTPDLTSQLNNETTMNYLEINRHHWNQRTEVHLESEFYDMPGFRAGKTSLQKIELEQLGDIKGKKLLHLQCHFGQDTLSLARMGAKVTGVDLSNIAIDNAQKIATELDIEAQFICCNVLEIDQHLKEQYDIIFTSYGTIGWLPQLNEWASLIHQYLKPGGVFHFVEFHPVVWMFDDQFQRFEYSYFNVEPVIEETEGTYADRSAPIRSKSISWNHPFNDVLGAILQSGLILESFREFDYSPYDCFDNTIKMAEGYQIKGLEGKIPMVYALKARKRSE